ncbi:MAG: hypothetical protein ACKO25_11795 [Cyanobium sp.]
MPIPPSPQPSRPVAWALLSQTIWLPLLAVDLHDRWQSHQLSLLPPSQSGTSSSSAGMGTGLRQLPGLPSLTPPPQGGRVTTGLLLGSGSPTITGRGDTISSAVEPPSYGAPASPSAFAADHLSNPAAAGSSLALAMSSASNPAQALTGLRQGYSRADLLGGPITLADLNEETTIPALALAEQGRRALSGDPFASLPEGWREPMRRALQALPAPDGSAPRIENARHVHVPSRRIARATEVPLALQADGSIDILSRPKEPAVIDEIRDWSAGQRPPAAGSVSPAVVHLHPVAEEIPQRPSAADLGAAPINTPSAQAEAPPPQAPPAPEPIAESIPLDALGGSQP